MEISAAVVRIAFVALPGLLAAQVYRKLRGRRQKELWETFSEVLLFSILSYTLWILLTAGWSRFESWMHPSSATTRPVGRVANLLATALFDENASLAWSDLITWTIAPACAIGFILALLASYVHRRGLLNKFGREFGMSRRLGDEDLWEAFFASDLTNEWLFVRDHKLDLLYYGHPERYSESGLPRELVLTEVSVYDNAGKLLYETDALYLSRESDDLTVETPSQRPQEVAHDTESTSSSEAREANDDGGKHGEERRGEATADDTET